MEPRAALGRYEDGRFTLNVCSQGVYGMRANLAQVLNVGPKELRVLTGIIGGSFGMKAPVYSEYVCVLHAARALGRPVKWTDERSGSFVSDSHGRDHRVTAELALDPEGKFLAVRLTSFGNMGGFLANVGPMPATLNAVKNVQSVYRTPLIEVSTKCVFTNTTHVSAYRGAGRPEANYYMERLIDTAAAEMEIDRLELRRRNYVRPQEFPYKAASGMTYDSGDFGAVMVKAIEVADAKGFPARRRESRERGKLRGLGVGSYLEVTARRKWVASFSRRPAPLRFSPVPWTSAWVMRRRSRRYSAISSGFRSSASVLSKATAIVLWWAVAPAAPRASCTAAPRSSRRPPK
jgi:carbon-monoxide dehydrogenase large subunit